MNFHFFQKNKPANLKCQTEHHSAWVKMIPVLLLVPKLAARRSRLTFQTPLLQTILKPLQRIAKSWLLPVSCVEQTVSFPIPMRIWCVIPTSFFRFIPWYLAVMRVPHVETAAGNFNGVMVMTAPFSKFRAGDISTTCKYFTRVTVLKWNYNAGSKGWKFEQLYRWWNCSLHQTNWS